MPPAGSRGRAETLLAFGHFMDTANLLCFLKFGNLKESDFAVVFAKKV